MKVFCLFVHFLYKRFNIILMATIRKFKSLLYSIFNVLLTIWKIINSTSLSKLRLIGSSSFITNQKQPSQIRSPAPRLHHSQMGALKRANNHKLKFSYQSKHKLKYRTWKQLFLKHVNKNSLIIRYHKSPFHSLFYRPWKPCIPWSYSRLQLNLLSFFLRTQFHFYDCWLPNVLQSKLVAILQLLNSQFRRVPMYQKQDCFFRREFCLS